MRSLLLQKNIGPERVKSPLKYWEKGSVEWWGVLRVPETLSVNCIWPKQSHEFFWHPNETSWRSTLILLQMLLPVEKHLPRQGCMCCAEGGGSPDGLQQFRKLRIDIWLPPSLGVLHFSYVQSNKSFISISTLRRNRGKVPGVVGEPAEDIPNVIGSIHKKVMVTLVLVLLNFTANFNFWKNSKYL